MDQRTFGWMNLEELTQAEDERLVPESAQHIACDIFEKSFDLDQTVKNIKKRKTGIKQALLNQEIVAGIGNIYADEALWESKTHWSIVCEDLSEEKIAEILKSARKVMKKALKKGGTSFDDLYIDVNGESGYFENDLKAYGREGERCYRCEFKMEKEPITNDLPLCCQIAVSYGKGITMKQIGDAFKLDKKQVQRLIQEHCRHTQVTSDINHVGNATHESV